MKTTTRFAIAGLAAALPLAMIACKPIDKETGKPVESAAADAPATGADIAGLKGEREQISYIIGNQMGEQLKQIKDEIDVKTLQRAIAETLDDKAIEISDE